MKIAIAGASGLVGSALIPLLTIGGYLVVRLVRRDANEGEVTWNPKSGTFDASPLEGIDGVVHLAGENIGESRWTVAAKQRFYDSRCNTSSEC